MAAVKRSQRQTQTILKIRELILSGEFARGRRVADDEAMRVLDVRRTSLRLALTVLEHQGYLKSISGGFIVQDFTPDDVRHSIEIRGMLEGMAARKLAERQMPDFMLEPLRHTLNSIDELLISGNEFDEIIGNYIQLNEEFHMSIMELANCPMIRRSMDHVTSLPFSSPNDFVLVSGPEEQQIMHLQIAQNQHKNVLSAIRKHEGQRVDFLMREHARLAQHNFEIVLREENLSHPIPTLALVSEDA